MDRVLREVNSLIEFHGLTAKKARTLYTVYRKSDSKVISQAMSAYGMKRWFAGFVAGMSDAGDSGVLEGFDELRKSLRPKQ